MRFWNGYGVDEEGNVYNKDGSLKSMQTNQKGYGWSKFYYNGRLRTHSFHKIVAWAYLGEVPEGCEVDHIDDDRLNNRPDNIRYITKSENNQKAYDNGNRNFLFGDTNPNSLKRKSLKHVNQ